MKIINYLIHNCIHSYKDEKIYEEAKHRYLKERYEYQHNYNASGDTKDFKKKESTTF